MAVLYQCGKQSDQVDHTSCGSKSTGCVFIYNDLGLLQPFRFLCRELLEVINEFNDGLLFLALTEESLLQLVVGAAVARVSLYFIRVFLFKF